MKGFRTLAFNMVIAAIGVLQAADWASLVSADKVGYVLIAVGAVGGVLRILTDTPVAAK